MTRARTLLILAIVGFIALANESSALPILDLYNTGVVTDDADGMSAVLQTVGMPDPHYTLTASPLLGDTATVLENHPLWLTNGPNSNWIGSAASLGIGASDVLFGDYYYQSTFTLPPLTDLSSVEITFEVATDNALAELSLNGVPTLITYEGFGDYGGPFTIDSSNGTFVAGLNTLVWKVANFPIATPTGSNPHGFRVDEIKGTYELVPEPSSLLLALMGFAKLRRIKPSGPTPQAEP
jgi:hypothetical protein